jgi:hypothetical protein
MAQPAQARATTAGAELGGELNLKLNVVTFAALGRPLDLTTHPHPGDPVAFDPAGMRRPDPLRTRDASARQSDGQQASLVERSNGLRLALWHRRLVLGTAIALAVTGVLWIAAQQALDFAPDLDGADSRSRMHALLVLHGVLAYAGAVLLGTLLGRHIPAGLRSGRRTATGVTSLGLAAILVVTALLLYYVGSDSLRNASSVAHQVAGVAAIGAVWIHLTRRERPRSVAQRERRARIR